MINLSSNINEVLSFTDKFSKQYRFAVAVALTKTAVDVQKAIYADQRTSFKSPTPYTMKGLFIKGATKDNLQAETAVKDRLYSKTTRSPAEIIGHQYYGGVRKRKAIEGYATRAGLIGPREYLVPSQYAKLDGYGNMRKGQVAQIMSQLRIGIDENQYATKSARSKRNQKKAGSYFWSRGGHLARGVWLREGRSDVLPVLMAEGAVRYRPLIDIKRIGDAVARQKFSGHLLAAWRTAMATAR